MWMEITYLHEINLAVVENTAYFYKCCGQKVYSEAFWAAILTSALQKM